MNDSLAAATPAQSGPGTAIPPGGHATSADRTRWRRRLLVLALVGLSLLAGMALIANTLHFAAPVHLSIDGHEFVREFSTDEMQPLHKLLMAGAVLLALGVAVVVVPLALAFAALMLVLVLVAAIGLPMLAVLAAAALLLSPLLLLWLLWKLIAP